MTAPFGRTPRTAVRPSPVFLVVLAVAAVGGYLAWQATTADRSVRLGVFLFVIGTWIVSLCLHEFAHAVLAWRFGDDEVAARGYLTLNPLKYSHPVLSILLPVVFIALGGIGLPGGAVYIHPHRFRSNAQRTLVSLSGPLVNVAWAAGLLLLARANLGDSAHQAFWFGVAFLGLLQITASILNLLPIPGLDGYGALEPYLDPKFRQNAEQFKPFGMLAIFALIQVAAINKAFFAAIYEIYDLFGVPRFNAAIGYELVKFWQ